MPDPDRSDPEIVDFSPKPAVVAGPPLTAHGKPEVLYVATEYCPCCAVQSWAMIVALSRFGTFTGLRAIRSDSFNPAMVPAGTGESFPPLDTWTFYGSGYSSEYLTFVPVETRSNVLVSRHANPQDKNSYTRLQRLTAARQAIFAKYDNPQAVPFTDFGNRYALTGSSFSPGVLEHETWSQVATALRTPHGIMGRSILGAANYITAAICRLTGDEPATACTPW